MSGLDLWLTRAQGIPKECIVSIRVGSTRRQAPFDTTVPYRFPAACGRQNMKIDVYERVAHARLLLEPNGAHWSIPLERQRNDSALTSANDQGDDEEVRLDFRVADASSESCPNEVGVAASDEKCDTAARYGAATNANHGESSAANLGKRAQMMQQEVQPYLDQHGLPTALQALLQAVIKERPIDPYLYMIGILQNSRATTLAGGRRRPQTAGARCDSGNGHRNFSGHGAADRKSTHANGQTSCATSAKPIEAWASVKSSAQAKIRDDVHVNLEQLPKQQLPAQRPVRPMSPAVPPFHGRLGHGCAPRLGGSSSEPHLSGNTLENTFATRDKIQNDWQNDSIYNSQNGNLLEVVREAWEESDARAPSSVSAGSARNAIAMARTAVIRHSPERTACDWQLMSGGQAVQTVTSVRIRPGSAAPAKYRAAAQRRAVASAAAAANAGCSRFAGQAESRSRPQSATSAIPDDVDNVDLMRILDKQGSSCWDESVVQALELKGSSCRTFPDDVANQSLCGDRDWDTRDASPQGMRRRFQGTSGSIPPQRTPPEPDCLISASTSSVSTFALKEADVDAVAAGKTEVTDVGKFATLEVERASPNSVWPGGYPPQIPQTSSFMALAGTPTRAGNISAGTGESEPAAEPTPTGGPCASPSTTSPFGKTLLVDEPVAVECRFDPMQRGEPASSRLADAVAKQPDVCSDGNASNAYNSTRVPEAVANENADKSCSESPWQPLSTCPPSSHQPLQERTTPADMPNGAVEIAPDEDRQFRAWTCSNEEGGFEADANADAAAEAETNVEFEANAVLASAATVESSLPEAVSADAPDSASVQPETMVATKNGTSKCALLVLEEAVSLAKAPSAPLVDSVTFSLKLHNVEYSQLEKNSALRELFESEVRMAVAGQAGVQVLPEHVALKLSAGSVVVLSTVTPPLGIQPRDIAAKLAGGGQNDNKQCVFDAVLKAVSGIAGIASVSSGPISVSKISAPIVVPAAAPQVQDIDQPLVKQEEAVRRPAGDICGTAFAADTVSFTALAADTVSFADGSQYLTIKSAHPAQPPNLTEDAAHTCAPTSSSPSKDDGGASEKVRDGSQPDSRLHDLLEPADLPSESRTEAIGSDIQSTSLNLPNCGSPLQPASDVNEIDSGQGQPMSAISPVNVPAATPQVVEMPGHHCPESAVSDINDSAHAPATISDVCYGTGEPAAVGTNSSIAVVGEHSGSMSPDEVDKIRIAPSAPGEVLQSAPTNAEIHSEVAHAQLANAPGEPVEIADQPVSPTVVHKDVQEQHCSQDHTAEISDVKPEVTKSDTNGIDDVAVPSSNRTTPPANTSFAVERLDIPDLTAQQTPITITTRGDDGEPFVADDGSKEGSSSHSIALPTAPPATPISPAFRESFFDPGLACRAEESRANSSQPTFGMSELDSVRLEAVLSDQLWTAGPQLPADGSKAGSSLLSENVLPRPSPPVLSTSAFSESPTACRELGEAAASAVQDLNARTFADDEYEGKLTSSLRFRVTDRRGCPIGIRAAPSEKAPRIGKSVFPGDEFLVADVISGDKGQQFLKLADQAGWLYTQSPQDGRRLIENVSQLAAAGTVPSDRPHCLEIHEVLMRRLQDTQCRSAEASDICSIQSEASRGSQRTARSSNLFNDQVLKTPCSYATQCMESYDGDSPCRSNYLYRSPRLAAGVAQLSPHMTGQRVLLRPPSERVAHHVESPVNSEVLVPVALDSLVASQDDKEPPIAVGSAAGTANRSCVPRPVLPLSELHTDVRGDLSASSTQPPLNVEETAALNTATYQKATQPPCEDVAVPSAVHLNDAPATPAAAPETDTTLKDATQPSCDDVAVPSAVQTSGALACSTQSEDVAEISVAGTTDVSGALATAQEAEEMVRKAVSCLPGEFLERGVSKRPFDQFVIGAQLTSGVPLTPHSQPSENSWELEVEVVVRDRAPRR